MKKTFDSTKAFRKNLHLSFVFPHKLLTIPNRFKVTSFFYSAYSPQRFFRPCCRSKVHCFTQVGLEKCELLHFCFSLPLKLHIDRGLCWNYFKAKNKPCLSQIGVNRMSFGGYSPPADSTSSVFFISQAATAKKRMPNKLKILIFATIRQVST